MILESAYILDIKRTPMGKFLGGLSEQTAPELASLIIKYFANRYDFLTYETAEVILGNVIGAGIGQNPARMAAYRAGLKESIPAMTLNHVCGSGLTAIIQATRSVRTGDARCVVAGGMESMSKAPHLLPNYRKGLKYGNDTITDSLYNDGLYCSLAECLMGVTAENIARKYKISRERQDRYALKSHQKAIEAIVKGYFKPEILTAKIDTDEAPRVDTTLLKLAALPTVFEKGGSVTAGNSSGLSDGAAVAVIVGEELVITQKLTPMAKILAYSYTGLDPKYMGMGAYHAVRKMLLETKLGIGDVDLFEINEAFAAQTIAVIEKLELEEQKVNVSGGAIALGHPLGASGARVLTTLVYNLKRLKKKYGIASLCIGGGQGVAMLIENI